jgi:excisionase family DNA binding protein
MTQTQRPWRRPPEVGDQERLLKPSEVAHQLNVSPRAVLAWCKAGKIPSIHTPGGHRRIPESAVRGLMVARNERTGEEVGA